MHAELTAKRRRQWALAVLASLVLWSAPLQPLAVGQETKKDAAAPKAAEKVDAAKAEPTAAPADAAQSPADMSFLKYCYVASPTFFIGMGALSIYFFAVVIDHFLKLRLGLVIPPKLVAGVDAMLGEKKFKEAYDVLKGDKSLFARSVTAGVEKLSHGIDRGMDAMINVAEEGKMEMEHKASIIATIGQISPMLGLLGTVLGMVLAFQEIAKGGQPKPAELANNIGLALISTLEGLILAIPAIFFFGLFRNKISRLAFEVESLGETYLWRFASALKK